MPKLRWLAVGLMLPALALGVTLALSGCDSGAPSGTTVSKDNIPTPEQQKKTEDMIRDMYKSQSKKK